MTNATSELAGVVGRFQLGRRLGAGAFGTVYEAEDVGNNQRIALKQLHVLDGDALYRFKQEFRSAADIVHPNLVALKELFAANGHWYMTMEFIDGVDFRVWVRGDSAPVVSVADDLRATHKWAPTGHPDGTVTSGPWAHYDETRLRTALTQLVAAVHELHRHNVLHRDLKPSNVMISSDQRLRVLDYGLAAPIGPGGLHASLDEFVVGTPAYMSPEQAEGLAVSTASDWYSVGVMLFEVLTGRLPFEGTARDVLWRKVHEDGPDPRTFDRDLPDDLASLCRALLVRDPLLRPQHAELAALVGALARDSNPVLGDVLGSDVFVGRGAELGTLRAAAKRLGDKPDAGVVIHVQGPSGVGKSALVRRFLEDIEAPSIVLAGRCYERESVPFKALDSLVDTLTQYLRGLSPAEVDALLPKHAAALARVFPVLSRLEAFAGARILDRITDPNEVRRRAGLALRELLDTLAKRQQLILWIDDLQWGDADSAVLFRELVAPPDPPPMMLVLSYRSEDAAAEMVAAVRGRRLAGANAVVELAIAPLPTGEAEQLASTLLGEVRASGRTSAAKRDHAKRIANESGGIPFFVHELARTVTAGQPLGLSLTDVIAHRIAALDEAPRRLLDVVAAAGGPIDHRVARTAANTGLDELILLRAAHFLRSRGDGDDDLVECFHDRVRETALEHMSNRADIHRRIATALEREREVDPEALVAHFRAAGDDERTLHYAERAAELAEQKLAFDRAADLYELAASLAPEARRQTFAVRYAEALANAGRGVEAARAFRTAADGATGEDAVRLRTRAAEQFLRSGHLDDGVAQLEPALAHMSLKLPSTASSALVTLLARRARLKLRGLRFTERTADQLSSSALHRIDLCWSVGNGLGGVDMVRAATFQAQHLLLALDAGEPYRVSRAIAWESIVRAMEGGPSGRRRASELGATAKAIAERIDHPHARAWAAATDAIAAECEGRWREAQAHSLVTIALFREAQTDVAWEVGSMYAWWLLPALYFAGDLSELAFQAPDRVEEVDRIGDLYTATSMRTYVLPLVHLVAGDPDRAEAETRGAIDKWSRSGWHLQHWCDLKSRAEIALYRGDGVAAVAAWDAEHKALAKSLLLRMTMVGVQTRFSLGRALVAAAAQRGGDPAYIARAAKLRAALAKIDTGWAQQFSRTLAAGIAQLSGDHAGALAALVEAAAGYRGIDMSLHAAAAELVHAELAGGDATTAESELRAQGVADPHALAAALVPGFAKTRG